MNKYTEKLCPVCKGSGSDGINFFCHSCYGTGIVTTSKKKIQTILNNFFKDGGEIEMWFRLGALTMREYWLLTGTYTTIKAEK